MTYSDPAKRSADALGLRLIMSLLNDDIDMTNKTLTEIHAEVNDEPKHLSYVCMSLASHCVSALECDR